MAPIFLRGSKLDFKFFGLLYAVHIGKYLIYTKLGEGKTFVILYFGVENGGNRSVNYPSRRILYIWIFVILVNFMPNISVNMRVILIKLHGNIEFGTGKGNTEGHLLTENF